MESLSESLLRDLAKGKFVLTRHARERMNQRRVAWADILSVGRTGLVESSTDSKFKVVGLDLDGDELTIVCAYEDAVVVITLF